MQKILRTVAAILFLIFIGASYFYYHPYYFNSAALDLASFCPSGGALFCGAGITWLLLMICAVLAIGLSLYRFLYHGNALVTFSLRPVALFLYAQGFLLLLLSIYFFQSDFSSKYAVGWGAAMTSFMALWGMTCFYLLLFLLLMALIGYRLLQLANTTFRERSVRIAVSIGLGMSVFIFVSSILGQMGLFSVGPLVALAVLIVAFSFPVGKKLINDLFWEPVVLSFGYNTISWFLFFVLALLLAMNIIDVARPFPIGWDDMGVYMNFPRQIASHQGLLPGYAGQAYMLITALGFTIAHSTTVALFFSWLGGVLAIYALYAFGKQFISSQAGLLMAAVMYSLPMVMHQSFADLKTDMGLFFFLIVAFLCLLLAIQERENKSRFVRLLVLTGVFVGTALAIKITTAIALFPILAIVAWRLGGPWSGIATFALINSLYFYKFVTLPDIPATTRLSIASVSAVIALFALGIAVWHKERLITCLKYLVIVGGASLFVFSPWLIKNVVEAGAFTVEAIMWGGPAPAPRINWNAIGVDPGASCVFTAVSEELGRYISRDTGLARYAVVPWEMTMNLNQTGFYVDIGFVFLAFIALLSLFYSGVWSLLFFGVVGVMLPVLDFILPGFTIIPYVPTILLGELVFFSLYDRQTELEERKFWQNIIMLFVLCWYFWLFVASGVPWYGVVGFLFALLLVVRAWLLAPTISKVLRGMLTLALVIGLLATTLLRETKFGSSNLLAYSFGVRSADQVLATTNPLYPAIIKAINSDVDHYVYRIGTFINYFIDNNRERVFDDAQLDVFTCIDGDGSSNVRTLERLKTLGFKYLIYDTNTASIEKDPNGTLHQKTKRFMDFARATLTAVAPTDPTNTRNGIILFEIK